MNLSLSALQPYPFEKLNQLIKNVTPPEGKPPINLSIGEPKHPTPRFITESMIEHLETTATYPTIRGNVELRAVIADWLIARFSLPAGSLSGDQNVLLVNGTREALFAFAQCVVDNTQERPVVVIINPFYQIYEGAALLAGAEPWYMNCVEEHEFLPDFQAVPEEVWQRCQLLYLCSPGNPTGAVIDTATYSALLELADEFDFIIASDECYSEIYLVEDDPPVGLLQAAAVSGRTNYQRCIVFHSLSKRSNAPGMRSGFVAGDAQLIQAFFVYRTYHGCAMPLYTQAASLLAWQDEKHVRHNRALYREKFEAVLDTLTPVMKVHRPKASFYLWPETPIDDTNFAYGLIERQNVTVLPGSFLSRTANGVNPGHRRIRIALVAPLDECVEAAVRIRDYINTS